MQQRTRTLETNLADVMIGELAGHQAQRTAADSDDHYPLIEVLRDAAFGIDIDDAAITRKLPPRGVVIDADDTIPHSLYSAPYERVDVGVELPPRRPARNRPATIARDALAERSKRTAPYAVQYVRSERAPATPASGSFEAAWFVSPDDAVDAGRELPAKSRPWLSIAVAVLAAITIALLLLV